MKDFLLIGNKNCIAHKEFFKLMMDRGVNIGYTRPGDFDQPDGTPLKTLQGLTRWFTTLSVDDKPALVLTATYSPEKYPKYDNYDAINVDKVRNIPKGYDCFMGVPITIFQYDLTNFVIADARDHTNVERLKNKSTQLIKDGDGTINGKAKYARVLIRRKQL